MGRIEEAINVVHLLADQPPIDNDRRRVFPLVVCIFEHRIQHISTFLLVTTHSKSCRKI
jgi:hypothetical protein